MLPGRAYINYCRCISGAQEDIQGGTLSEEGGGTVDPHVLADAEKDGAPDVVWDQGGSEC